MVAPRGPAHLGGKAKPYNALPADVRHPLRPDFRPLGQRVAASRIGPRKAASLARVWRNPQPGFRNLSKAAAPTAHCQSHPSYETRSGWSRAFCVSRRRSAEGRTASVDRRGSDQSYLPKGFLSLSTLHGAAALRTGLRDWSNAARLFFRLGPNPASLVSQGGAKTSAGNQIRGLVRTALGDP
jgi:hypothetical protein